MAEAGTIDLDVPTRLSDTIDRLKHERISAVIVSLDNERGVIAVPADHQAPLAFGMNIGARQARHNARTPCLN